MANAIGKAAIALAALVGVYGLILGALMTPRLQRFALYANKINTLFYHDINNPEEFGFCENQVQPFNISTPDREVLHAWHVLPIDVYTRHEKNLKLPPGDEDSATPLDLLINDPQARVVVSYPILEVHGNAGHVAQGWRTDTIRQLTTLPHTHVITVDYRGFGHSTGSPTEAGLITDGVALVNWVLHVAYIPPEQIVLMGQSLGTAVASAVGLEFLDPKNALHPGRLGGADEASLLASRDLIDRSTVFAGIVLVAPFANLPSLMLTYRMGGLIPLLLPLRPFPALAKMLTDNMVDKWPTEDRLRAYYDALISRPELLTAPEGYSMGSLQIIHGFNDMDITYRQTEMICRNVLGEGEKCINGSSGEAVYSVSGEGRPGLRFEIFGYGGRKTSFSAV
ncbi:uncharacterized protein LTR77_003726 [Saxophila tyrrhenica]|uniref:AB hydrolase-1 domain-containing protein n=1 Tax=Saxophila tyrrhenica TaxID=1690608 RepID=A0AAV9PEF0_9PEZI|nr:hypothetical protein LTR77_003726 [Saxophila tyrrhenica]